jgi:hypothetical protein
VEVEVLEVLAVMVHHRLVVLEEAGLHHQLQVRQLLVLVVVVVVLLQMLEVLEAVVLVEAVLVQKQGQEQMLLQILEAEAEEVVHLMVLVLMVVLVS